MIERAEFYSLTELYDILHTPGTAREVDGLERIARKFAPGAARARSVAASARTPGPVWLEPACGTGRYLRVLANRGYRAVGFDSSPEMIAYAGDRMPEGSRGKIFIAGMDHFAGSMGTTKVDFAFNLINTIRHLPSDGAMLAHFEDMARVMRPDAVYIVGLSLTAYGREREDEDLWTGRRGATKVTQIVQYLPPEAKRGPGARTERVISHLAVRSGRRERDITSAYTLRCYSLEQWSRLVGRSALRVVASVDEDGRDHAPRDGGYNIFVLARGPR